MSAFVPPVSMKSALRRPSMWLAVVLVVFGVLEALALARRVATVPTDEDWRGACAFVRSELGPHDQIRVEPRWISAFVRRELGDAITPAMIGASDDEAFDRVWLVSIRGKVSDDFRTLKPLRTFGRVAIYRRDRTSRGRVVASLAERIDGARVELGARPCEKRAFPTTRGGGLGTGPIAPASRFVCDARNESLWVARTINEDLSLEPRDCIYQPAQGRVPLRVTFDDVPLGDELVFYGGLYAEAERMQEHAPIDIVLRSGETELGRFTHRDGEGWTRHVWPTSLAGVSRTISVEVSSQSADRRMFCWSAYTRTSGQGAGDAR